MVIFNKLEEEMKAHAMHDFPLECVGIVTKDMEYIRCKNISITPKTNFFLDPADLVKYDDNIFGVFHSHPGSDDPIPSKEDKMSTMFSDYKFFVGFTSKIYTYWYDANVKALKFEEFESKHLVS